MTRHGGKKAAVPEVVAIHGALVEHFDKEAGAYKGNMSDEGILKLLGYKHLSAASVAKIRLDFGMRMAVTAQRASSLELMAQLETRVEALERKVEKLVAAAERAATGR